MKVFVTYSVHKLWKQVVREQLEKHSIDFTFGDLGELEIQTKLSAELTKTLAAELAHYGIEFFPEDQNLLVLRIKEAIRDFVYSEGDLPPINISTLLSQKLHYSYGHLTAVFSEATSISIAHYTIMQKVERIKELIIETELSLTEISFRLNYSSLAHLSSQFKQITGLSPKRFKEIIEKKRLSQTGSD